MVKQEASAVPRGWTGRALVARVAAAACRFIVVASTSTMSSKIVICRNRRRATRPALPGRIATQYHGRAPRAPDVPLQSSSLICRPLQPNSECWSPPGSRDGPDRRRSPCFNAAEPFRCRSSATAAWSLAPVSCRSNVANAIGRVSGVTVIALQHPGSLSRPTVIVGTDHGVPAIGWYDRRE